MADKFISENHIIVKLSDGSNDYYFSDINMDFGAIKIWDRLDTRSFKYKAGQDPLKKTWKVSSVKITLFNNPYRIDSSDNYLRPSDDLTGLFPNEGKIYLMAGSGSYVSTFPTNCLLLFDGYIAPSYSYNSQKMEIDLIDKAKLINITLPQNVVKDTYSDASEETQNLKIPIAYGEYTLVGDESNEFDYSGLGLARMILVDTDTEPKFVVASHPSLSSTPVYGYIKDEPKDPILLDWRTDTHDDSGHTTVEFWQNAFAYLYPSDMDARDYHITDLASGSSGTYEDTVNSKYAYNRSDSGDYALVRDHIDDSSVNGTVCAFGLSHSGWLNTQIRRGISELKIITKVRNKMKTGGYTQCKFVLADLGNSGAAVGSIWVNDLIDETGRIHVLAGVDAPNTISAFGKGGREITGDLADRLDEVEAGIKNFNGLELLTHYSTNGSGGDNVDNNAIGLQVFTVYIKIKYIPEWNTYLNAWASLKGRLFGSWVDADSRDNGYDSGDLIEDPAMIAESLLRDEGGFTTSEIDTDSFDAALNSSVKARLNLHSDNEMKLFDAIKLLCEQSTFNYYYSGAGKAKLIPLNETSPTTDKTFYYDQIVADQKGEAIINVKRRSIEATRAKIKSRLLNEYGKDFYVDYDEVANTTQESALSYSPSPVEYAVNLRWNNISGTSVDHVANFYIRKRDGTGSDSNGLWAYEWIEIEFEIAGFMAAVIEPGDWIELDDTSVDPHILCAGVSWSGKQFLVEEITVEAYKTKIKAIELL
jgi:hypothetical protein